MLIKMNRWKIFAIAILLISFSVFGLMYFISSQTAICCAPPDGNSEAQCNYMLNKETEKVEGNKNYSTFSPPDVCFEQGEPIVSELEGVDQNDTLTYRDGEYVVVDES